jgi:hypothetical protein
MAKTKIEIKVLRETLNSIFDFIEYDLKKSKVELPWNLYWSILDNDVYRIGKNPDKLVCGNLTDDFEFITSAHLHREQAIPIMFLHLAPLLHALALTVPSYVISDNIDDNPHKPAEITGAG